MATTPRYIGTSSATAKTYLKAALGWDDQSFLRVFDLDGDGAVASTDDDAFVRAVCSAETEVDEALAASHGAPFAGSGITDSIKEIAALRVPWCAVRGRSSTDSVFLKLYEQSDARLKRLRTDSGARIPGQSAAAPIPSGGVIEADPDSTDATTAWSRHAAGA